MKLNSNSIFFAKRSGRIRKKFLNSNKSIFKYSILLFWALISIYPFIWTFGASLRLGVKALDGGINPFVGSPLSFENYKLLFADDTFGEGYIQSWITNSLTYSSLNATINLFFNFLTGYALAKLSFRGRKNIFYYFLVLTFVPAQITQIPTFLIVAKMNLLPPDNNFIWYFGILVSSSCNTYLIFMVRQFFKSTKTQVDEAARIDGLSVYGTYFRVVLRTMIPLIATQFSLVFMWSWNNFIIFRLYAGPSVDRQTIVTGIAWLASGFQDPNAGGKVMAASTLTSIPVFFVYGTSLIFQKRNTILGDK